MRVQVAPPRGIIETSEDLNDLSVTYVQYHVFIWNAVLYIIKAV